MKRVLLGLCIVSGLCLYSLTEVGENLNQKKNSKEEYNKNIEPIIKNRRFKKSENLETMISKKKKPLGKFNYLYSKIIRSDADNERLEKQTLNKKMHDSAKMTLLHVQKNGFSGKSMIEREVALSFLSMALERNPSEEFILNEIEDIVIQSLSKKYDRRTQKTINADVLDLLSILDEFNPEYTKQMIQNDKRVLNYFEYMKVLKQSMGEQS